MKAWLFLVFLFVISMDGFAASAAPCQVHVILFVPADVRQPAAYQQRVDEMVAYAEAFFARELKRWGHQRVVMPFRRAANGRVEVTMMRGKQKTAQYKPVEVRGEVMDTLRAQNKITAARQVWWILVYAGDPPKKFPGYLGGYGVEIGGWAVCNFDTRPGRIDPAAPLGSDFLEDLTLKGMLHELGHGFQLPHIGPLKRDKAGNTLMGPTHFHYQRVIKGEQRVYLCEAEAAMLANHPAFRGVPDTRLSLPQLQVQNLKYVVNAQNNTIVVSGSVRANQKAVHAFVADEADDRPGEYWTKTYVGKVGANGAFEVVVTEPSASKGTLMTWFAFENGAQTGDGKERGRESGVPKAYVYTARQWVFK